MLLGLLGCVTGRCGRRGRSAASTTCAESSARRSRDVRTVGAETEIAAMTVPRAPRTGAAVEQRPSSSSSQVVAIARAPDVLELGEQVGDGRDRVRPELREPARRRLRRSEGHEHLAHRRGVDRDPPPDPVPVPGAERMGAVDLGQARDAGRASGSRRSRSRPVARPSRSRNGHASVARSPTLVSRRAYSTSTGPGRKPPPCLRCASPLRSSARRSRAAVDFGSRVSSISPASVTASSLSTRRTRMRAARSIAWDPSSAFAMSTA